MTKMIIVGEKPSKYNLSEDIPFVGAACFNRLVEWIKKLEPDYYVAYNSETERELRDIELLAKDGFKVIALGVSAATRLRDRGIEHFTLPHPSGRNLLINDKELMTQVLKHAWLYLRGELNDETSNG